SPRWPTRWPARPWPSSTAFVTRCATDLATEQALSGVSRLTKAWRPLGPTHRVAALAPREAPPRAVIVQHRLRRAAQPDLPGLGRSRHGLRDGDLDAGPRRQLVCAAGHRIDGEDGPHGDAADRTQPAARPARRRDRGSGPGSRPAGRHATGARGARGRA